MEFDIPFQFEMQKYCDKEIYIFKIYIFLWTVNNLGNIFSANIVRCILQ